MPILSKYQVFSRTNLLFIVGLMGFLEMLGGYIGWSKFRGLMEKWLKDDIEFIKELKGEKETGDFIGWLKVHFARKYLGLITDDGEYDKFRSKRWLLQRFDKISLWTWKAVKSGGVILMFVLGAIPVPGFRVVPDILCGTLRWRLGFIALSVSNFLKTAAFVYGWSWIFS